METNTKFELVPVGDADYVANPAEVWARLLAAQGFECATEFDKKLSRKILVGRVGSSFAQGFSKC